MQVRVQEFDFEVKYVPGTENGLADLLSRQPHDTDNTTVASMQANAAVLPDASELFGLVEGDGMQLDMAKVRERQSETLLKACRTASTTVECIDGAWCETSTDRPRVIIPAELRTQLVRAVHEFGHPGTTRTWHIVKQQYFWPGMCKDVKNVVRECQQCQCGKVTTKPKRPPMSFPVTDRFQQVHVDLVGPLPMSSGGNSYMFTMIDRCSRWLEAIPINNISADNCAKVFLANWIARYGVPDTVTSDQGKQFDGHLFKKVLATLGVYKIRTTGYHPQSNGILERQHRTIKDSLRCLASKFEDWEQALPVALLAIRNSIHANGFAPTTMVFGEATTLPIDLVISAKRRRITEEQQMVRTLRANAWTVRDQIVSSHGQPSLANDDNDAQQPAWVWVEAPPIKPSLAPRYKGPYRVQHRRGPVVTIEQDGRQVPTSIARLKPAWGIPDIVQEEDASESDSSDSSSGSEIDRRRKGHHTRSGRLSMPPTRLGVTV